MSAQVDEKPQETEKKKSSSKKWIIMGVLVLLLAGGGAVAYFFFFADTFPVFGSDKPVPPVLYPMDSFLVNLSDPGGKRYLKVNMELHVDDQLTLAEVKEQNHAVRDSILLLLSGKVYDDISSPAGKLTLKREIITRLNRLLTKGQVKEVYFTEFLVQ